MSKVLPIGLGVIALLIIYYFWQFSLAVNQATYSGYNGNTVQTATIPSDLDRIAKGTLAFDFEKGEFVDSQPIYQNGIALTADIQVSMAQIDTRDFVKRNGYENLFARIVTFIVISDDPYQRSELMLLAASRGASIIGVYESCNQWQSVGSPFATIYLIGGSMAAYCAGHVQEIHPIAVKFLLHDTRFPPLRDTQNLSSDRFRILPYTESKYALLKALADVAKLLAGG